MIGSVLMKLAKTGFRRNFNFNKNSLTFHMFDFSLSNINTDIPSPLTILYALLLSFILSACISFTYEKTTGHNKSPGHFIQSMILGAIIAAIVAQAIGDSIGRGLGMLGILAMIRFRTNLNQPRNMIFIFASLAIGIACGVFAFNIALYGTLLFCLIAFLMDLSPLSMYPKKIHSLRVTFANNNRIQENTFIACFNKLNIQAELIRIEINSAQGKLEKEYFWELKSKVKLDEQNLMDSLMTIEDIKSIRFNMRSEEESI